MRHFDAWFDNVLRGIVAVLENWEGQKPMDGLALPRALYSEIHLHGAGELDPDPELPNSLVRGISLEPPTFTESGWIVSSDLGSDLLLKRRNVHIRASKNHKSLVHDPERSTATIKRDRRILAIMPDWDRIVSAQGWPSPGDARIYLPTASHSKAIEDVVEALDSSGFSWHLKTTRREDPTRPDSVVLYVQSADIESIVNLVKDVIPEGGNKTQIPGFSFPCDDTWTVGVGLVRPESQEVSYGWTFATDLSKKLISLANCPLNAEDQARSAIEQVLQDASEGRSDVKISW